MTNKATRDKIKQACRLYSEFAVQKSRLICKICKTHISMTSRTKMIELEEHFKTINHLKSVRNDENPVDARDGSETASSTGNLSADETNGTNETNETNDVISIDEPTSNANQTFPSISPDSVANKSGDVKIEMDDDIKCEYENLKSFIRPIKQELDTKAVDDFSPANQLFYTDLIQLCLNVNISLTKFTSPEFCSFFTKHFKKPIPSLDKIRTHVLKPKIGRAHV